MFVTAAVGLLTGWGTALLWVAMGALSVVSFTLMPLLDGRIESMKIDYDALYRGVIERLAATQK